MDPSKGHSTSRKFGRGWPRSPIRRRVRARQTPRSRRSPKAQCSCVFCGKGTRDVSAVQPWLGGNRPQVAETFDPDGAIFRLSTPVAPRLRNAAGRRRFPDDDLPVHDLSANRRRSPRARRRAISLCARRCRRRGRCGEQCNEHAGEQTQPRAAESHTIRMAIAHTNRHGPLGSSSTTTSPKFRGVAPGGIEPPHADSKSAALSTELRGRYESG